MIGVQVEACAVLSGLARGRRARDGGAADDRRRRDRRQAARASSRCRWSSAGSTGSPSSSEDEVGDAMADAARRGEAGGRGRRRRRGRRARLAGRSSPRPQGTTAVILSGGNIDESLLAAIARRSGARHGRGAVLFTTISDRPGSLARLLDAVGATRRQRRRRAARARRRGPARGRDRGRADPRDPRRRAHRRNVVETCASDGYARRELQHTARRSDRDERRRRKTIDAEGAPEAIGPYSHAVAAGGLLFCSGQIPLDPESGEIVGETPAEQATQCLRNLEAVCDAAGTEPRPRRAADDLHDRARPLRRDQRGLRGVLPRGPARPARPSESPRCPRARSSRSTRSWPSGRLPGDDSADLHGPRRLRDGDRLRVRPRRPGLRACSSWAGSSPARCCGRAADHRLGDPP